MSPSSVLIVKTSSLGDVIHALPALNDAAQLFPQTRFDWLVEAPFADVVRAHPAVDDVICTGLRRWRRAPLAALASGEVSTLRREMRTRNYDVIVDLQGLVKSAVLARGFGANVAGYDPHSIREPFASHFYQRKFAVAKDTHAIARNRSLLAQSLGYADISKHVARAGLPVADAVSPDNEVLLLFGTTWANKHWPLERWRSLAQRLTAHGFAPRVVYGNAAERSKAEVIVHETGGAVLPAMSLAALMQRCRGIAGFVGVDSGLAHLMAAMDVPGVCLYGPTSTDLTGVSGAHIRNLRADLRCAPCRSRRCFLDAAAHNSPWPPCMSEHTDEVVLQNLLAMIEQGTAKREDTLPAEQVPC